MSQARTPQYPIDPLFTRRWSPRAFTGEPIPHETLSTFLEAARWAPSSYNEQPWRYVVATRADAAAFEVALSCLVEGNRVWARFAPVLAFGCTSLSLARTGKPNAAAQHDLGLASASLTLEATARGLYVHQMIGILPERVREAYGVPAGVEPLTGLAIGYLADPATLPEALRPRDAAPRTRKELPEFVFGGTFRRPATWLG